MAAGEDGAGAERRLELTSANVATEHRRLRELYGPPSTARCPVVEVVATRSLQSAPEEHAREVSAVLLAIIQDWRGQLEVVRFMGAVQPDDISRLARFVFGGLSVLGLPVSLRDPRAAAAVAAALTSHPVLKELSLNSTAFRAECVAPLLEILQMPSLEAVDLRHCSFPAGGLADVIRTLAALPRLRHLELDGCDMREVDHADLKRLAACRALETLRTNDCLLSDHQVLSVCLDLLRLPSCTLRVWELHASLILDKAGVALARLMLAWPELRLLWDDDGGDGPDVAYDASELSSDLRPALRKSLAAVYWADQRGSMPLAVARTLDWAGAGPALFSVLHETHLLDLYLACGLDLVWLRSWNGGNLIPDGVARLLNPGTVEPLKSLCRGAVRRAIGGERVLAALHRLPFASHQRLVDYVMYDVPRFEVDV